MTTLYAGNLMTVTERGYTKHYFAESDRILSNIAGGGYPIIEPREELKPITDDPYVLSDNYTKFVENYFAEMNKTACKNNEIGVPAYLG
jgi:hypothetical protein